MNGPVTPESLHDRNEALLSENERLTSALAVLTWEREQFILFANTLVPPESKPVLVGPIQVATWHIERLNRALNQAVTHARPELPTPQDRAKLQLSEDSVLFHAFGGYREWHECPELAAHLRQLQP